MSEFDDASTKGILDLHPGKLKQVAIPIEYVCSCVLVLQVACLVDLAKERHLSFGSVDYIHQTLQVRVLTHLNFFLGRVLFLCEVLVG